MLSMNRLPFQIIPKILIAVSLTLALGATLGCENDAVSSRNTAAEMTRSASIRLEQIAASTVYPMSPIRRAELRNDYTAFLRDYDNIPQGALAEQKAHLNALAAEAQLALTKLVFDEAAKMEEPVHQQLSLVLQDLGSAMELAVMVSVSREVDYSALKATIDQQGQLSRARQNDLKLQAQQVQKRIADLQSKINAELADFDRMGNDAATRREQAFAAPLAEQISILEEAAALSRQADTHQVRAANLEAALDLLEPELQGIQTKIAQTETELISFESSRSALMRREEVAGQNVVARQADHQKMASAIANDLEAIYVAKDAVRSKYDEAIEFADGALNKANAARRSPGGETRIIQAYQNLGSAHWRRAQFLERVAAVAQRMAEEKAVLGRGDNDRVAYESIQPDLVASIQSAGSAFTAAAEAANNLSSRDVDEVTRRRLVASLNETVKSITGSVAIEETDLDEDVYAGTDEFTDNFADATDTADGPRSLLRRLAAIESLNDGGIIFDYLHPAGATDQKIIDFFRAAFIPYLNLERACKEKFGTGFSEQTAAAQAETGASPLGIPDFTDQISAVRENIDTLEFQTDSAGTTAWISNNRSLEELVFVNIDGEWKIQVLLDLNDAMLAQMAPMIEILDEFTDPVVNILNETAERIQSGDLATFEDATGYLNNAIMAVVLEHFSGAGGGIPGG